MLAYQPVRSLSTLNMVINQGIAAASRILPIIDTVNKIKNVENASKLEISNGTINFKDIYFSYDPNEKEVLKSREYSKILFKMNDEELDKHLDYKNWYETK